MINLYMVGVFYLECRMAKRVHVLEEKEEEDRSAGSPHVELIQPWFIQKGQNKVYVPFSYYGRSMVQTLFKKRCEIFTMKMSFL